MSILSQKAAKRLWDMAFFHDHGWTRCFPGGKFNFVRIATTDGDWFAKSIEACNSVCTEDPDYDWGLPPKLVHRTKSGTLGWSFGTDGSVTLTAYVYNERSKKTTCDYFREKKIAELRLTWDEKIELRTFGSFPEQSVPHIAVISSSYAATHKQDASLQYDYSWGVLQDAALVLGIAVEPRPGFQPRPMPKNAKKVQALL